MFRLMFAVYIFFTALVLVNLLIAMMTNRYERARQKAKCTWRFNAIAFGLRIERMLIGLARGLSGRRLSQLVLPPCRHYDDPIFHDRYLLDVPVKKTSAAAKDTETRRLREDISRLAEMVREVDVKLDMFQRDVLTLRTTNKRGM